MPDIYFASSGRATNLLVQNPHAGLPRQCKSIPRQQHGRVPAGQVKPHNAKKLTGDDDKDNIIDPKTGKKKTAKQTLKDYILEEQDNFRVVGTAMYAALAAHLPNKKYLKKDDIESLLFLLSYFGVG